MSFNILFYHAEPYDGVAESMRRLKALGNVTLVTFQRHLENMMDTLVWLDDHGIVYDNICFVTDKSLVGPFDYFIDDNVDFVDKCNSVRAMLVDMPYNRRFDVGSLSWRGKIVEKVSGFNEFVRIVEDELNNKKNF